MATRAKDLADQFEAINGEYLAVVRGMSDEQWRGECPADGRTVGVVAHHMATVQGAMAGMIAAATGADGLALSISADDIERMNADHARDHAGVGREETLEALRTSGEAFVGAVRPLSDADLERGVGMLAGFELTVGQVMEHAVIGHAAEHLAAIRGAVE